MIRLQSDSLKCFHVLIIQRIPENLKIGEKMKLASSLSTLLRAVVTILKEELMREVPAGNAIIRHCSSAVAQQTFNVFNGNCIFFFFFLVQPCHFVQ